MRQIYVKFNHKGKENAGDFVKKKKLYRILPQNTRGYIYKTGDGSLNIQTQTIQAQCIRGLHAIKRYKAVNRN